MDNYFMGSSKIMLQQIYFWDIRGPYDILRPNDEFEFHRV
jgi:hypothetical protein